MKLFKKDATEKHCFYKPQKNFNIAVVDRFK